MTRPASFAAVALIIVFLAACAAGAPPTATAPKAAVSPERLRTWLSAYAADSMAGREAGTAGGMKATAWLAEEARRLGLEPAGENGTYFQVIPLHQAQLQPGSAIQVGGRRLTADRELLLFGAVPTFGFGRTFVGEAATVYGGRVGDRAAALTVEQVRDRLIVYDAPLGPDGTPTWLFWESIDRELLAASRGALVATLAMTPGDMATLLRTPRVTPGDADEPGDRPFVAAIDDATARSILGADPATLRPGATGRPVRGTMEVVVTRAATPARNVIAILRGSDPALRGQFVAVGAHNDHLGVDGAPVDHDSLRAHNRVVRPVGKQGPDREPTAAEAARIRQILDSLRKVGPPRLDSVYNGADDDGSGSVATLAIAEALLASKLRLKRSILFVWHTGEEKGLWGSRWYTDHPTVPLDSIVAQLNIDMVGRGAVADSTGAGLGGPSRLMLIGSRRLSTELGDLIESINTAGGHGFSFDYGLDANGHPLNVYCRSDHYMYARYGIPITFFTTGLHQDYHMVTDEVQYIDFPKMARISTFVADVALRLANNAKRPVVDKPKPDPQGACSQ
ncbi:MAG: M28 family peptidase [Gemmatimonadales bacterium]|nr:M28 family peptidase [Gemmatimonadales bacterium]